MHNVTEMLGLDPGERPSIGHVEGLLGLMDVKEAEHKAQVARLEAELAEAKDAYRVLRGMEQEARGQEKQAKAANAAKDAALEDLIHECIVTQDSSYGGKSGYLECRLCGFDFLFADREHHAKDCAVGKARAALSDGGEGWQDRVADYFEKHGKKALQENANMRGEGWLEVREQAAKTIRYLAALGHQHHKGSCKDCDAYSCREARAALDTLGE